MHSRFLLGLLVALFPFLVQAGVSRTTSGAVTTYNKAAVTLDDIADATTAANGDILTKMMDNLPASTGGTVPVEVSGKIPKATAAAAVGRFMTKALPVFGTSYAAYELMKELGYDWSPLDGMFKQEVKTSTGNTIEYQFVVASQVGEWSSSRGAALASASAAATAWYAKSWSCPPTAGKAAGRYVTNPSNAYSEPPTYTVTAYQCGVDNQGYYVVVGSNTYSQDAGYQTRTAVVTGSEYAKVTKSVQDLVDEIMANEGWPTDSFFDDAVREAVQSGESVEATPETVTGPASSTGTTTSAPGAQPGTTVTTSTVNNYTYNTNQVTTSVTTTTVTRDAAGNVISTTTSTDAPAAEETPFEMPCGIDGKTPCNVKVDETGTEEAGDYSDASTAMDDAEKSVTDAMTSETQIRDLGGAVWAFIFPAGACTPIAMGFGIWRFTLDLCSFPNIGLFRAFWAWAFGVMGALYIWRSTTSALQA